VRDGAEFGLFNLQSLSTDGSALELSIVDDPSNYKVDNYDNFSDDPNRTKEIVDGRLKLATTVSDPADDNQAFLRFVNRSNYIEAELEYASESSVDFPAGEGFASVRIAGILYNVNSAGESDELGYNGNVWGSVNLIRNGNDSGQLAGEYCLIRNDSDDWTVTTDLADGMNDFRCPVFNFNIEEDTAYKAALGFDPVAGTVTFSLGDETHTLSVGSDVFIRSDETLRVQTRMAGGATGTVVAFVDNLRNDPDALTDEEFAETATEDTTTPAVDDSEVVTVQRERAICLNEDSDSDGDGWGWENNDSCVVSGSSAQQQLMLDIPPVCTSDAVAVDDLGWGWEDNATCIVLGSAAQQLLLDNADNDNSNQEEESLEDTDDGFVQITDETISAFFDKQLFLFNGESLTENFIVVRDGGSFDGTWNDAPIAGTWEMRDGYWCRVITEFFNPDRLGSEDCQLWELNENRIRGTRDRGTGASFVYNIVE